MWSMRISEAFVGLPQSGKNPRSCPSVTAFLQDTRV